MNKPARSSSAKYTAAALKEALIKTGRKDLSAKVDTLQSSFFDPTFEPILTAKSPEGGKDIVQASSNNFYYGVTLADLKNFKEKYRLNSRVVQEKGKIKEEVYRAGTPDGKVKPGLYAEYLRKAIGYLEQAQTYASPAQRKVIADLIEFYKPANIPIGSSSGLVGCRTTSRLILRTGLLRRIATYARRRARAIYHDR